MILDLKPDVESLSTVSLIIGIVLSAIGLFSLIFIDKAKTFWLKFPRNVWFGRVLTVFCFIWTMLWLFLMPLGFMEIIKQHLWWLTPVAIFATCLLLPDLLTCRAVGALLLLVPACMFSSAAWHSSVFRYLITVLGYVFAIAGMFYIAMPWTLRDNITWALKTPMRFKICAISFISIGLIMCILAFTVF